MTSALEWASIDPKYWTAAWQKRLVYKIKEEKRMNKCQIHGCRYLQTTCVTCGQVICEKILPKAQEWISVKDRLPPEEENVILYDGSEVFCGNMFMNQERPIYGVQGCDGICYGHYKKHPITHWMPLPEPPECKENE